MSPTHSETAEFKKIGRDANPEPVEWPERDFVRKN